MANRILITGCSGGGKSTLLAALRDAGHHTVEEPGRRIVRRALADSDKCILPWNNMHGFAKRALAVAKSDWREAQKLSGHVFFDRGLIDATVALEHAGGPSLEATLGEEKHYANEVLVTPPWPALFSADRERQHSFESAVGEYDRLMDALERLGYACIVLPQLPVGERARYALRALTLNETHATDRQ